MKRLESATPAQARQTREEFANPDAYLDYELYLAVKKLPPLYTRLVGVTLSLAVFGAIAWAAFYKVDEVAVAPGKIIPSDRVQPVRACVTNHSKSLTYFSKVTSCAAVFGLSVGITGWEAKEPEINSQPYFGYLCCPKGSLK